MIHDRKLTNSLLCSPYWDFTCWASHFSQQLDSELTTFETEWVRKSEKQLTIAVCLNLSGSDKATFKDSLHLSDICRRK
jgi:hypothetical protein